MLTELFIPFAGFNSHSAFPSLRKTISECWHQFLKIVLAKDKQSLRYRNIFYTGKKKGKTHGMQILWLTVAS